jgi:hypothetical protein
MNPAETHDFLSQALKGRFIRIVTQELNNLENLGQRRLDPVLFPEIDRDIRNIKLEGKLALGELQIQPPNLNPIAPRPTNIRVFLPGNRLFAFGVIW